jgi:uracil-DNA glycosylase
VGYDIDNVGEGIKFPGLYGDNEDYGKFYYQYFSRDKVFCAPRGNINKYGYVVMGLNPGAADESEILHEPMWLFGNSSNTLHRLLQTVGIYPYFTDMIKEPFKQGKGKSKNLRPYSANETEEFFIPHLDLLKQEISLLSPRVVILLGSGERIQTEYSYVKEYLDEMNRTNPNLFRYVTIEHPRTFSTDAGRSAELKDKLKKIPKFEIPNQPNVIASNAKRHEYPFCDIQIKWNEVDNIPRGQGHGIEIWHGQPQNHQLFIVAFVHGFSWYHGESYGVQVDILEEDSSEFIKDSRNLVGHSLIKEAKMAIKPYLITRESPGNDKEIGGHVWTWLNS